MVQAEESTESQTAATFNLKEKEPQEILLIDSLHQVLRNLCHGTKLHSMVVTSRWPFCPVLHLELAFEKKIAQKFTVDTKRSNQIPIVSKLQRSYHAPLEMLPKSFSSP